MQKSIEKFSIGSNRKRPPYKTKALQCPSCSAPLSIYSEKSQLIICSSCNMNLNCTKEELVALGKPQQSTVRFAFSLHQECILDGIRYKVIARLRYRDRWKGFTRVYLLFHPFHGTRWLSEYKNTFSISENKRVRARSLPDKFSEGCTIQTEDGITWVCESESQQILTYVDGALPWIAKTQDTSYEVEFEKQGDKSSYLSIEVEHGGKEITYTYSHKIPAKTVNVGFGLTPSGAKPLPRRQVQLLRFLAILCMIVSAILIVLPSREYVTEFAFDAASFKMGKHEKYSYQESKVHGIVSPSFSLSASDVQKGFQLEYPIEHSLKIELLKADTPAQDFASFDALYEKEKKESNQQKSTRIVVAKKLSYRSDIINILASYNSMKHVTNLLSRQRYPTGNFMKVDEPGHYRIWVKSHKATENFTIDVSKNVSITRFYIFSFLVSFLVLLQSRRM